MRRVTALKSVRQQENRAVNQGSKIKCGPTPSVTERGGELDLGPPRDVEGRRIELATRNPQLAGLSVFSPLALRALRGLQRKSPGVSTYLPAGRSWTSVR